jgi:hypothetical protein
MKRLFKEIEIAAGTRRESFVVADNPRFDFLVFLVMSVELVFPLKEVVVVGGVSRLSASWDAFLVRMTPRAARLMTGVAGTGDEADVFVPLRVEGGGGFAFFCGGIPNDVS